MARVSVELDIVQMPAGWMWRFRTPDDLAPPDPRDAALAGLTGPFASEVAAQDSARRTLELIVREYIAGTLREPVEPAGKDAGKWLVDPRDGQGWTQRWPRNDVRIEGAARPVHEGSRTRWEWTVAVDGTLIARGRLEDAISAKSMAGRAMLECSADMPRKKS